MFAYYHNYDLNLYDIYISVRSIAIAYFLGFGLNKIEHISVANFNSHTQSLEEQCLRLSMIHGTACTRLHIRLKLCIDFRQHKHFLKLGTFGNFLNS